MPSAWTTDHCDDERGPGPEQGATCGWGVAGSLLYRPGLWVSAGPGQNFRKNSGTKLSGRPGPSPAGIVPIGPGLGGEATVAGCGGWVGVTLSRPMVFHLF